MNKHMRRHIGSTAAIIALALICFPSAWAQAPVPSNLGHIGPSGAQVGAAIAGTAAVTGVVLYFALRKPSVVGCTQTLDSGIGVKNERDKRVYTLTGADPDLKSGRRVKLRGKKIKQNGKLSFQVKKVIADYGSCTP